MRKLEGSRPSRIWSGEIYFVLVTGVVRSDSAAAGSSPAFVERLVHREEVLRIDSDLRQATEEFLDRMALVQFVEQGTTGRPS